MSQGFSTASRGTRRPTTWAIMPSRVTSSSPPAPHPRLGSPRRPRRRPTVRQRLSLFIFLHLRRLRCSVSGLFVDVDVCSMWLMLMPPYMVKNISQPHNEQTTRRLPIYLFSHDHDQARLPSRHGLRSSPRTTRPGPYPRLSMVRINEPVHPVRNASYLIRWRRRRLRPYLSTAVLVVSLIPCPLSLIPLIPCPLPLNTYPLPLTPVSLLLYSVDLIPYPSSLIPCPLSLAHYPSH